MDNDLYYRLRPAIPRRLQVVLRQWRARHQYRSSCHWPIWEEAGSLPPGWPGWPGGKRFAVVLTHDVERESGLARSSDLADLEEARGFRSAFGFVPRRYQTPASLRHKLVDRGFEVIVHDLYHDGKLYRNWRDFAKHRELINEFLHNWQVRGFSSGSMHHNLQWISQLNIDYSTSTYDVDPFEPQRCGLGRIFPYWVQSPNGEGPGYVEMPYTLPQDFTLLILLGEQSNEIWHRKLDWIAAKGGMALLKTHPDYMVFPADRKRIDGYPVERYTALLDYIAKRYGDEAWFAQPSEMARFWRGLRPANTENTIPFRESFCATCRQAHAEGWLLQYRPHPEGLTLAVPPLLG